MAGLFRVFLSRPVDGDLEVRIPADFHLDPVGESATTRSGLQNDGFALELGASGLEWRRSTRRPVADVEDALFERLGLDSEILYSIAVEPDGSADGPDLRRAMKTLALERSNEARTGVYRSLATSTVLVAVERCEDEGLRALADEDLGGRPTWLGFSGIEALAEHPSALEHVSMPGIRLVRAALSRGVGALRLDFASNVGGELYANELRSIADAIPAARPPGARA